MQELVAYMKEIQLVIHDLMGLKNWEPKKTRREVFEEGREKYDRNKGKSSYDRFRSNYGKEFTEGTRLEAFGIGSVADVKNPIGTMDMFSPQVIASMNKARSASTSSPASPSGDGAAPAWMSTLIASLGAKQNNQPVINIVANDGVKVQASTEKSGTKIGFNGKGKN